MKETTKGVLQGIENGTEPVIEFPITNDIVFNMVMSDPQTSRDFLKLVFPGKKIGAVKVIENDEDRGKTIDQKLIDYLNTQQVIEKGVSTKGVRLDVFIEDENTWYDIELQCRNEDDLPQRSRYYHSLIDTYILKKGQGYGDLQPAFVIFLCTFDLFKKDLPRYSFEMICEETTDSKNILKLDDGQGTIILNTKSSQVKSKGLIRLFDYFNSGKVAEGDAFIERMHKQVLSMNEEERRRIVRTIQDKMMEEHKAGVKKGVEIGRKEGLDEGRKETAQKMKAKGYEITDITEITGLAKEEIEKL